MSTAHLKAGIAANAELMQKAGCAVAGIARPIHENLMRECDDEGQFLNSNSLGALTDALELIGDRLSGAGERLERQAGRGSDQ